MATQAECQSMRDVMKSTLKKILFFLFWITIAVLSVVLLSRVSDLFFSFISRQAFISTRWFFWLLTGLSIASVLCGVFLLICSVRVAEKEIGNEFVYFGVIGLIGMLLPLFEKGILLILENYLPGGKLSGNLALISEYLSVYSVISVGIVSIIFFIAMVIASEGRY